MAMAVHKRRKSKLSLEPNPFEQSFSLVRTNDGEVSVPGESSASQSPQDRRPSSTPVEGRVKLPPVSSISGPLAVADSWGPESLRSGPLSPAMLGGPAEAKGAEQATTSRLGLTDPELHTGLTPFLAGETHPAALATPGLQAMIREAFGDKDITATPGGSLRISSGGSGSGGVRASRDTAADGPAAGTTTAQPIADYHKQREPTGSQPALGSTQPESMQSGSTQPAEAETGNDGRSRAKRRKGRAEKPARPKATVVAADVEEDDEKRRQFLERNRVAALKCRKRKKRQLQELQAQHDFAMRENERLRAEYLRMRECSVQVRALLAAHSECSVARANGVFGADGVPRSGEVIGVPPPRDADRVHDIVAAIPPASNGVPVHDIAMAVDRQSEQRPPLAFK